MKSTPRVQRTHDSLYLDTNPSDLPKHSFVELGRLVDTHFSGDWKGKTVVDVGCAVGHFPAYLCETYGDAEIAGLEYVPELVDKARTFFPHISIIQGSVLEEASIVKQSIDVITMLGVLQIFDDIEPIIKNLLSWLKGPGSALFIHGLFNPHPIDTFTKYRLAGKGEGTPLESGWNIISQETVSAVARSLGASDVIFYDFNLPFDLKPNPNDSVRSWTELRADGTRQIVNGLGIVQPQYIARIVL